MTDDRYLSEVRKRVGEIAFNAALRRAERFYAVENRLAKHAFQKEGEEGRLETASRSGYIRGCVVSYLEMEGLLNESSLADINDTTRDLAGLDDTVVPEDMTRDPRLQGSTIELKVTTEPLAQPKA